MPPVLRPAARPLPARPPRDPGAPLSSDTPPEGLRLLNRAPAADAEATLLTCCGSHRWARRMTAHRPYPTLESLLAAADEAAYDLAPADLAEALQQEDTTPLPDRGNLAVHTALRAAHAAYEAKFGHVFVIALDTADPAVALDQAMAGLRTRLDHDEDRESAVTAEQLRRITRARLARLATRGDGPRRRALAHAHRP
ncbi:2-oxo-4-hydroxy-4-carboxy-5-ureidoimidazoline decarboxylase [Streptomyces sp. CA2R106]|uniref:2-oxo-4-hydroxy-4-carboxy-5-ureidoimidazoline decarboxylase n=1 Tax=Streptomyces sp. CA2R106 TaxID=3120153 RepID=UPI0030081065